MDKHIHGSIHKRGGYIWRDTYMKKHIHGKRRDICGKGMDIRGGDIYGQIYKRWY